MTWTNTLNGAVDEDRKHIVNTLQELVRIPSLTGEEREIGSYIANACRKIGLSVKVIEAAPDRPNIIAEWDSGLPGPTLLLQDHLDTFPPGTISDWRHHPYAATIEDNHVFGRGAIDTKSGVTTVLTAVRAVKESKLPIRGKLILIFSCDEETGGSKLGIKHLAKLGYLKADMALVAEPTTMQIEIGTKSRLLMRVTTRGVATHGARPWLGHNAITDMVEVIRKLEELDIQIGARKHPLLGQSSMNIGTISGGTIPNIVPDRCILDVDRRLVPAETQEAAVEEVNNILQGLTAQRTGFNATLEVLQWWPGYIMDEDDPVVAASARAFKSALGTEPKIAGKDAATEASWINLLANIPVVMFSPGEGARAGNIDESIDIDDLVKGTRVIAQFIREVLSAESSGGGAIGDSGPAGSSL